MSTGQRLNMTEALLDNIRVALEQEILKLTGSGSTPQISDAGYHAFWRRIESYAPRIQQVLAQLKSMGHAIDLRRQGLWDLPRERRYAGKQSVDDQDRHLRRVHDKALAVLQRLETLRNQGRTPTKADLVKSLNRLSKEIDGIAKGLDSQASMRHLSDSMSAGQTGGLPGASFNSVALLIALIWLAIRRGPKKD